MAKKEYRVLIQGGEYLGFDFLDNVITVAKQGGVVDRDQVRMSWPQHAVMFLESDEKLESTPTITYTLLSQEYFTEAELEALSIAEFRNAMQKVNIKGRNRSDATVEYLSKFGEAKIVKEIEVVKEDKAEEVVKEVVPVEESPVVQEETPVVEDKVEAEQPKEEIAPRKRGPKAK